MRNTKCVVLLSGGLDSTVLATFCKSLGYDVYALTIIYGQRHEREIEAAAKVAQCLKLHHQFVDITNIGKILKSALTDRNIPVPLDRDVEKIDKSVPVTYVPFRNTIFLAIACGFAESIGAQYVYYAANAIDYSGYPDCRPDYVAAFNRLTREATKDSPYVSFIEIRAPFVGLTKEDIVRLGVAIGAPLEYTWSCYSGGEKPCEQCDSCKLRAAAFARAGIQDPAFVK